MERDRDFNDPVRFLQFAHERGANAVQLPLGIRTADEANLIRSTCDRLGLQIEGIVSPPKPTHSDRFQEELKSVAACGASIARIVMSGGRRYEIYEKNEQFLEFTRASLEVLQTADRTASHVQVTLAVENHKDYRVEELVDVMKRLSSEWTGVCLDTGNNLALLEDPLNAVSALAPFARTVHLKDMGLEESENGFLLSEVPLGRGTLNLPSIVAIIRKASPRARFHLEMITRDPLSIPCLTEKYWATMPHVPGQDLARTLKSIRSNQKNTPLPRVSSLKPEEQLAVEERHVRESFEFAARTNLIPAV